MSFSNADVEQFFDEIALTYDEKRNKRYLRKLKENLLYFYDTFLNKQVQKGRFLDLGCGTGEVLEIASRFGFKELWGTDISQEMAHIASQKNPKATVKMDNLEKSSLPKNYFDLVFCLDVFEHLCSDKIGMDTIMAILRKKGIALIGVSNPVYDWLFPILEFMGFTVKERFHKNANLKKLALRKDIKLPQHNIKPLI